jgi:hypothetical protein
MVKGLYEIKQLDSGAYLCEFSMDHEAPNNMVIDAILYTLMSQEIKDADGVQYREVIYDA